MRPVLIVQQHDSRWGIAMRYLGLSGRILGDPRLFHPNSSTSAAALLQVHDTLRYLERHAIRLYRLPPQVLAQASAFTPDDWAELGAVARHAQIRLSVHLDINLVFNNPDQQINQRSIAMLEQLSMIIRHVATPDPVIVAHLGGAYDNRNAALMRGVQTLDRLSHAAKAMLALEPDGRIWSLIDLLHVHAQTGIPIVYDHLHHQLLNPHGLDHATALNYALATWQADRKPKIHFSSPRTELRISMSGKRPTLEQPQWYEHSDFAHPFELIALLRQPCEREYDVMLECKAGDLAIERVRSDLARFAPELDDVS